MKGDIQEIRKLAVELVEYTGVSLDKDQKSIEIENIVHEIIECSEKAIDESKIVILVKDVSNKANDLKSLTEEDMVVEIRKIAAKIVENSEKPLNYDVLNIASYIIEKKLEKGEE
jgi:hypothetical protein